MLGRSKCKVGLDKNDLFCLFVLSHLDVTLFIVLGEKASVQTGLAMEE